LAADALEEERMANEALEQFYRRVMSDPSLQTELKDVTDERSFINRAVELGARNGFYFTADEAREKLEAARAGDVELSDEQLESVAAGYTSYGDSTLCGYCGKTSGTSARTKLPS
jgi:predicted ribosomally synthesized peptide with nif11-like leader